MLDFDLSHMNEDEYQTFKQYLKDVYDIDSIYKKAFSISPNIVISC